LLAEALAAAGALPVPGALPLSGAAPVAQAEALSLSGAAAVASTDALPALGSLPAPLAVSLAPLPALRHDRAGSQDRSEGDRGRQCGESLSHRATSSIVLYFVSSGR